MHYINAAPELTAMSLFKLAQSSRLLSTTSACARGHYDSLGITPKATQADVKEAYYKLSMLYHPDKNKGDEAAKKFRDISEAYEVLGNVRLRRLYDKGAHIGGSSMPDDPSTSFYRSREARGRAPMTGRTPVYDFDEWSKAHYGATFAKDQARREKIRRYRTMVAKEQEDIKRGYLLAGIALCFGLIMYFTTSKSDYDVVSYSIGENIIRVPRVKDD